jgi:hypothetical protein
MAKNEIVDRPEIPNTIMHYARTRAIYERCFDSLYLIASNANAITYMSEATYRSQKGHIIMTTKMNTDLKAVHVHATT